MAENDMFYELSEFIRLAQAGEHAASHHRYSLDAMEILDEARRQCDIVFPADRG